MPRTHSILALGLCGLLLAPAAFAATDSGKTLQKSKCQSCHDDSIYTRNPRIVNSYPELQARVEFCDTQAQTHWNKKQLDSVINYLNNTFYKFKKP
jgi:cytochrome c553